MDYQKIYWDIIYRAQKRDNNLLLEVEKHHIIPRSEGGSSKKSNLVELTIKEHFIVHKLLIKMGKCLKYCYRHLSSSRDYVKEKRKERKKKGLYYEREDADLENYEVRHLLNMSGFFVERYEAIDC